MAETARCTEFVERGKTRIVHCGGAARQGLPWVRSAGRNRATRAAKVVNNVALVFLGTDDRYIAPLIYGLAVMRIVDPELYEKARTGHGYRDLADRAAGFSLTRWLYAQCWTGTERPSALFDRATTWMLAHKVLLPGATTLERFVAKLRHRVDVRVWRVLASGISPPQQRRLEDLLRVPDEGRSSSLVTLRTGAAMVSGPALVRALERLNAVRSLSITVPAAAAIAPTRIAALARFAEKAKHGCAALLRSLKDLDALALTLAHACAALLDPALPDNVLRDHVFARVPRATLAEALGTLSTLVRLAQNRSLPR